MAAHKEFGTVPLANPLVDEQRLVSNDWGRFFSLLQQYALIAPTATPKTASGTWTKTGRTRWVLAILIGGGGGGAGYSTGSGYPGGGGGAGAIALKLISVASVTSITVTIGAGGAGGAQGTTGSNGTDGTASTLAWTDSAGTAYTLTAGGGLGGVAYGIVMGQNSGRGGGGGTPAGGDLNLYGQNGESFYGTTVVVTPGGGGFGGARPTSVDEWSRTATVGAANTGGGGGAGAYAAGGAGGSGVCLFVEIA